ncbi:MAG: DUF72 domain-containing protein [Thermodesulfovibrionales bacterium]
MIETGTCSWTEKTLLKNGEFYPKNVKTAEGRLAHYARFFRTVEVDSTYYALPSKNTAFLWSQRAPDGFVFHLKAFAGMTGHGVDPTTLPADLRDSLPAAGAGQRLVYVREPELKKELGRRFTDALSPLSRSGKLGLVVFQFPPWFRYSTRNLDEILACRESMRGLRIAVEFRHGSWLVPEKARGVLAFLREHAITYVFADEPQYGTLATIPFLPAATTEIAYVRFHGRNRENWLRTGIETSLRYDYLYTDEELAGFIPHLKQTGRDTRVLYAMFNNCHGASAVRNALRLREMLEEKKKA